MLLNRERAEEKMAEHGIEALISTSPANVFYTSDTYPYGNCYALLPIDREVDACLVAPVSGPTPVILMSPTWMKDVRYYGEFYIVTQFAREPLDEEERALKRAQESWEASRASDPAKVMANVLRERDIVNGKIGVEETHTMYDHSFWDRVSSILPGLEAVPAVQILKEIRMIKSNVEVRRIHEAIKITEKAWNTALESVEAGTTERAFCDIYSEKVISEGASHSPLGIYYPPIGFGRRCAFPDIAKPSDYVIQPGDVIRLDGGCSVEGYACDIARTAVYKEPSKRLKKYWRAIFLGEQAAISIVEPGVEVSKIFEKAIDTVRGNGIPHYMRHHTGHGWGVEGYDPPIINPENHTPLEEGMVICIETPYYEVGWGGLLHEDKIVVTDLGCRVLSTHEEEMRVVG
ncbi:MAG: M24 family metallopeptidase [Promethearchaeota archaeon]